MANVDQEYVAPGADAFGVLVNWIQSHFVEKETGKSLSEEDFTVTLKQKLSGLTKNYEELDNLPMLEGVELTGQLTLDDLNIGMVLQETLDNYAPTVTTKIMSTSYNTAVFAAGTRAELFTVNHMTTVRLKIVIPESTGTSPITNGNPIPIFTEKIPGSMEAVGMTLGWSHLGRYTDVENVAIEFKVDAAGQLSMINLGQIPSDRTYETTFTYISL